MKVGLPAGAAIALVAALARAAAGQPTGLPAELPEVDHCPPPSAATPEELTRRRTDHYDRGVVLYEQGDYQAAVREFVAAYCDKPHPSMFYNIGQAYERMLEYDKAVAYLERFIGSVDDSDPNRKRATIRVQVLSSLPGRILVATAPRGAEVTLSNDTGVVARAQADGAEPIQVRKGSYTMRIEQPGFRPIEKQITVEIGRPYSYYFQLEPKKGTVRVVAVPADARIFLGDRLVGVGSYVDTVAIGRYDLTVEAEGRPAQRKSFEVAAEKTTDLTVALKPAPRSGRWELVLASGALLGGAAGGLATSLFTKDQVASGVIAVGGTALGFGGAYLGIPHDLPVGTSSYIIGSTLIGSGNGALVASMLNLDTCTAANVCSQDSVRGGAITGGAVGAVFSSFTAGRFDLDAGQAAVINSGAIWGGVSGMLMWASFGQDPGVFEPMTLAGLDLGTAVGAIIAPRAEASRGHIALIDLGGLGGMVAAFSVGKALSSGDERLAHLSLVGVAVGLISATYLTRTIDEPKLTLQPGLAATADGGRLFTLAGEL